MSGLLADLDERGLIHESTDRGELERRLSDGPITLYCGLDPTADSLHVGNLQSLLLLRRFQDAGHRAIALAGGATGLIGDPSGRDSERQLLDDATVSANVEAISAQMRRFLAFDGPGAARLVDNREWTAPMTALEFLRDVGKHVTVNTMLGRDSVRSRLDRDTGLSFTEFSYMLLQANDFRVLHRRHGCELQVAGSDQWGNICAGIDLIRRESGAVVHGLVAPLIVASDGRKFGKSTGGGGLWLSSERTSPYQLYQYFMSTDDRDVGPWLARLTLLGIEEIASVVADHDAAPERREGQRRLASEIVALVHGADAVPPVREATDLLFGGMAHRANGAPVLEGAALEVLHRELPVVEIDHGTGGEIDEVALMALAFGQSRGEVRRNSAGYRTVVSSGDGLWSLVRKGKSDYRLVHRRR